MDDYIFGYWLFWVAIWVIAGTVAYMIIRRRRQAARGRQGAREDLHRRPYLSSASLDVLEEQLMRGEITREEYDEQVKQFRAAG